MDDQLSIQLRPSRITGSVLTVAHVICGLALWLAALAWPLALAGTVVLAGSLVWALRRHAWRAGTDAILALRLDSIGNLSWWRRDGSAGSGVIGECTYASNYLVVLAFKEDEMRAASVLIACDSVSPDEFRRLRVWLRWRQSAASAASEAQST